MSNVRFRKKSCSTVATYCNRWRRRGGGAVERWSVGGIPCGAGSKEASCWAVRPLAAGAPLVPLDELRATACQGCPSCGGQLTARGPRTRTAEYCLVQARKVGGAPSPEPTQELRVPRCGGEALRGTAHSRSARVARLPRRRPFAPRRRRCYASGAESPKLCTSHT